jgi:ADP-ribosyl-[dinitrogen reductase] hydrolase
MPVKESALVGTLLGTAVGDAIGLPYEGLSACRGRRIFGEPSRCRFLPSRGMVSDDTEHACITIQALIASGDDVNAFAKHLARGLQLWLLGIPGGIGLATLKATLKLWLGVPPSRSGVWSAGNGPAMRSAVLGASIEDPSLLRRFVQVSTRITHTDPKAERGAQVVALAARLASNGTSMQPRQFCAALRDYLADNCDDEVMRLVDAAVTSAESGQSTEDFARSRGLERGVSGYIYHTLPIVIQAWLRHQNDYRSAITAVIRCGGDTDTTAAITGGIIGSRVGKNGIPKDWLSQLWEWPRTVSWMEQLASQLHEVRTTGATTKPLRLPIYGVLSRNVLFNTIVLLHGFRRLAPPY